MSLRPYANGHRPIEVAVPTDDAAPALWRRLTSGLTDPWLDEIAVIPIEGDDIETSLDIWTVALTAALRDGTRRETAACVLKRLSGLPGSAGDGP